MRLNRLTVIRSLVVLVFLVVVALVLLSSTGGGAGPLANLFPVETVQVNCIIGSEKSGFLRNEQVQDILARQYGLEVSFRSEGSIEQATMDVSGQDCLWPSNTSALEIFRDRNQQLFDSGGASSEIIFNSPIVLYSWQPVVDGLRAEGIVTLESEGHYTIPTPEMVELITTGKPPWEELGVGELYGSVNVITTDPTRSNSGNMFYGLLANMIAGGGDVATLSEMEAALPQIKEFYDGQGYMENSSGVLFERFINTGMGANPIIANYESLIIEFSIQNEQSLGTIQDQIRIIYPTPTVWSSHPMIALTDNGRKLLEAMQDEQLQQIAWEQHGFRSGLIGVQNDVSVLQVAGIPEEVSSVMPLPRPDALIRMLEFLEG